MSIETLYADAHLTGNFANPNNALGNTPSTWAGVANTNSTEQSRWSMADPVSPLTASATQTIRILARKGSNSGNPSITVNLWDNGTLVREIEAGVPITDTGSGQVIEGTFATEEVSSGANVQIEVIGIFVGGSPSARNSPQIAYIEWLADVTVPAQTGERDVASTGAAGTSSAARAGFGSRDTLTSGASGASGAARAGAVVRTVASTGAPGTSAVTKYKSAIRTVATTGAAGASATARAGTSLRDAESSTGSAGDSWAGRAGTASRQAAPTTGAGGVSTATRFKSTTRAVTSTGGAGASVAARTAAPAARAVATSALGGSSTATRGGLYGDRSASTVAGAGASTAARSGVVGARSVGTTTAAGATAAHRVADDVAYVSSQGAPGSSAASASGSVNVSRDVSSTGGFGSSGASRTGQGNRDSVSLGQAGESSSYAFEVFLERNITLDLTIVRLGMDIGEPGLVLSSSPMVSPPIMHDLYLNVRDAVVLAATILEPQDMVGEPTVAVDVEEPVRSDALVVGAPTL